MAAFRIQVGKSTVESDAPFVEIGTHSACAVRLEDRIASGRHARITRAGSGFEIEDLGTATGTWRNGRELRGKEVLSAGDVLVVGASRLTVDVVGGATLFVSVGAKPFFFEPSSSHKDEQGALKVGGDGERLVRDEVAFGRFAGLRSLNWLALAAAILLLAWLAWPLGRGRFLDPGPLAAAHAAVFSGAHGEDAPAWLREHQRIADEQGCSACHDTLGGTPPEKCAQCHATLVAQNHPFQGDRSTSAVSLAVEMDEDVCASCHLDHSGAQPAAGTFVPAATELAASCTRCHVGGRPEGGLTRRPSAFEPVPHEVLYDRFPHAAHADQACSICHQRDAGGVTSGRDFARVPFERCMDCHSADAMPTEWNAWGRDPALADHAARVRPEHQVRLSWHGSKAVSGTGASRCLDCHASVRDAALRRVEVQEHAELAFTLKRRAHADRFGDGSRVTDASGRDRGCVECHASGAPQHAGETTEGRFWHEVHATSLRPQGDAASDALSDECLACHADMRAALHLAGTPGGASAYQGPALGSCAACHREERANGVEPLLVGVAARGEAAARTRNDFPHEPHVRAMERGGDGPLAAGCFACHSFRAGERPFQSEPITHDDAASCISCHYDHENVGGPAATGCALCHPQDAQGNADPVWSGRPTIRMRADTPGFSHWSRGHAGDVDAGDCAACHGGVEKAVDITQVPIPSEAEDTCFNCHLRDRFHWRGAPAAR